MHRQANPFQCIIVRVALALGLIAVAAQAIAPICLSGFVGSRATGGISIVLCSAHGLQTINLDANGNPVNGAPDNGNPDSQCPMCVACHAASLLVPLAVTLIAVLFLWSHEDRFSIVALRIQRRVYAPYLTRGPPTLL
jgi:hypothetical protein